LVCYNYPTFSLLFKKRNITMANITIKKAVGQCSCEFALSDKKMTNTDATMIDR